MNRHTEFFGPDLARGPFVSHRIETAAVQIATLLAQIRAPLSRSDDDLRAHADFIRELADRLAPDWASSITLDVGSEADDAILTSINAGVGTYSLLHCWLADDVGAGVSGDLPDTVEWTAGAVLQMPAAGHYLAITPMTGVAGVKVTHSGGGSWRWAIARYGRVYYSAKLSFS